MTDPTASAPTTAPGTVQRLREDLIHPDPLLDCLIEVCRLNGQAASRASLSAGLPIDIESGGGLTPDLEGSAPASGGICATMHRVEVGQVETAAHAGRPV